MKLFQRLLTWCLALIMVLGCFAPAITARAEGGIPAITGESIFSYMGGDITGWTTNTAKVIESVGSVDGTEYSSRVFALGHGTSVSNPLSIVTPAFTNDSAAYDTFSVSLLAWDNGSDKDQSGLVLQYSVDGGTSWTDLSVTTAAHTGGWTAKSSGTAYTLYSHTVQDAACPDSAITNIRILPYGSTVYSGGGAFRLVSLNVTGTAAEDPGEGEGGEGGEGGETVSVLPTLSGDTLLYVNDGVTAGWSANSYDIRGNGTFSGTLEGKTTNYTIWPLGSDRPGAGKKLQITSPALTGDSTACNSFSAQALVWTNATDPKPNNLVFYYSTDSGSTWTAVPVTVTEYANLWNGEFPVYAVTATNVACPAAKITNVMLQPYGDTVNITTGAFRLISLHVTGSQTEGTVPLPSLSGDVAFSYTGATATGWTDNTSRDVLNHSGTLNGTSQSWSVWPLAANAISGNAPLAVVTPALTENTTRFEPLKLQLLVAKHLTDDSSLENLAVYYSTDNGTTWSSSAIPLTRTEHGKQLVSSGGTEYKVESFVSGDISSLSDAAITNLKIMPFGNDGTLTKGAFRLISLELKGTKLPEPVRDDSSYIQGLIDNAEAGADGIKVVTIPKVNPNDPEGGSVYQLSKAIELPSNTTVKLDNCTLRLNDGVLCNIFISKGCYNTSMTSAEELTNISIIGIGNAVLDGGNHNGVTEKTATKPDGFSTIRYNTSIYFRNVNGFTVSGLTIKEPRYWGMTYIFSRNGTISNIHFDCSNKAPNQDGIDLRIGCNNIVIDTITGVTGDDTVALTALSTEGGTDTWFQVTGKDRDIHDVTIKNVKATCNGGHGIIRLLCHHGNKVYNIKMENIEDTGSNHVQGVLRIGDTNYAGSGTPMKYGEMYNVTVDGVISNGKYAIYAPNTNVTNKHVSYENVTIKYGEVTNLTIEEDPIEPTPITYLTGESIFAYVGGSEEGWGSNAGRSAVTNSGKLEEKDAVATVWPLGSTGANVALTLTTPKFTVDSAAFESYKAHLVVLDNGSDPDLSKLILSVSTDNGSTWTDIPLTMTKHGGIWVRSDNTTWEVHDYVSGDLTELVSGTVTHMRIMPFGNAYANPGAFRLISMDVKGEKHELTHYEAKDPTCKEGGNVEYWYCSDCEKNYADENGLQLLQDPVLPVDPDAHAIEEVKENAPTATEDGNIAHFACTLCGALFADENGEQPLTEEDVVLAALGYDLPAILEPVKEITEENVKKSDADALKTAKEALEALQEGDKLTETDAETAAAALEQIEKAQKVLEAVAAVEALMNALPAEAAPDDADALEAYFEAKKACNALSEHGKSLVDEAAAKKLTDLGAALVDYKFLSGDKAEWTNGSGKTLVFKTNGMFSKFQRLEIDGKTVDPVNYTVAEGSTIITLKASYLQTLKAGNHTVKAVYPDGSVEAGFTVKAAAAGNGTSGTPLTGDGARLILWIAVLVSAAVVLTVVLVPRKRKENS